MTKKKVNNKESIKAISIILLYFFLPYLVKILPGGNVSSIIIYVAFMLLLIYLYKDTIKNDFVNIKKEKKKSVKTIALGVFTIFLVTIILNALIGAIFKINGSSENDYSLMKMFEESPLVLIILTCVYYPIVEGIVFRKAVRDVIDKKWIFIIFSSLFYFFFNIVYTSMAFDTIMSSVCYFTTMMILSYTYWKTNNFSISVIILMLYNLVVSLITFI